MKTKARKAGTVTEIDYVIRASGIWNTRAPFHTFLDEHRRHGRVYALSLLSLLEVGKSSQSRRGESGKVLFPAMKNEIVMKKMWGSLRNSYPLGKEGSRPQLSCEDVGGAVGTAIRQLRADAVVRYVSMFEAYFHSWVLNYLLAVAESEAGLDKHHREISALMSPAKAHGKRVRPGWVEIVRKDNRLFHLLCQLPHIFKDPAHGKDIDSPVDYKLNAFTAMSFWREYRNLVVHNDSFVSPNFFRRNNELFCKITEPYPESAVPLRPGGKLYLHAEVFPSVCTTHYRAALALNDLLEVISNERRGHPFAPKKKPKHFHFENEHVCEPMLIQGDHKESLINLSQETSAAPL